MSEMFSGCNSLSKLPDISIWNTNKVIKMNGIFNGCSSLLVIPNISIWKTDNLADINLIFYGCSSLLVLPDISKWNYSHIKKEDLFSPLSILNSGIIDSNSYSNNANSLANNSILSINKNLENSEKIIILMMEMN